MTLQEIKSAVDSGKAVYWSNRLYTVIKDNHNQYMIKCNSNDNCTGLTWKDGVTMNENGRDFFMDLVCEQESDLQINEKHGLHELFNCVKFWNNKGMECHIGNNEKYATGGSYLDFILSCIAADCRVFTKGEENNDPGLMPSVKPGEFTTGKGGNHVWVNRASDNQRVLFFHF